MTQTQTYRSKARALINGAYEGGPFSDRMNAAIDVLASHLETIDKLKIEQAEQRLSAAQLRQQLAVRTQNEADRAAFQAQQDLDKAREAAQERNS